MTSPATAGDAFHVALTNDFFDEAGEPRYRDLGLDVLDAEPRVRRSVFERHASPIAPDQLAGVNGVVVLTPAVTADSLESAGDLLAVGRFGVGYDAVDVAACTAADVALFITTGAVDRSVAEATVGWMIALSHRMLVKDRLVRRGAWNERSRYMGSELRERTVGVVGLGGIARATLDLLRSFGIARPLAFDPHVDPAVAEQAGVDLVPLEQLLERSDFVSIHCPLTPQTRGLLGAAELVRMKPTAFLINTARGGIVDEASLHEALTSNGIAGAALDCFECEPVVEPHPFGELENVLLAPHSIAWTDELFRDIGRAACGGMVDLARGRRPRGVINPEVFAREGFRAKWARVTGRAPHELEVGR